MIATTALLAAIAFGDGFWEAFDEVAAMRRDDRLVQAWERLPRLDELATTDVERAYALGERVYLFTILGTPDRAAEPHRRMKERFAALGDAARVEVFYGELQYDLPYRLAVDDFAGAVRLADDARRDERWDEADPRFVGARLEVERQGALALAAWARQGGVEVDRALVALRRLKDDFDYRGPEILLRIGTIAIEQGRFDDARAALRDAEEQVATWREEERASELDELNLAVLRARLATGSEPPHRDVAELSSARAQLEAAWTSGLSKWAAADAEGGVGILHYDLRQDALSALIATTLALGEGAEAALGYLVETQEASALARALGAAGTTVADVRANVVVGDDHLVLVLLPATLGGDLFVISKHEVQHHPLEPASQVAPDSLFPAAVRTRVAAARRLTICAIGPLAAAPFERFRGPDGRPLARTHALDFAPSLPAACALETRARNRLASPTPTETPLVTVVSGPLPSAAALERWAWIRNAPLADVPWEDALAAYPPDRVRTATGRAATRDAFARAGDAAVLQLFAHGVFDPALVRPGTLVLSPADERDDGLFTCTDAERSKAPHLVFLGACSATAGPYRGGDESSPDFSGAFLAAGAAVVIAAAEQVDAYATLDLATRFHAHLANGVAPAEALRRARVERGGDPEESDGFRIVGAGQRPVFVSSVSVRRSSGIVIPLALAVVALLLGFGWRRRHCAAQGS